MNNRNRQLNTGSGFGRVGGFTLIEVVAVLITGLTLADHVPIPAGVIATSQPSQ